MAKDKQPPEERKPDLATPDQDVIEQRVKEMLDVAESEKSEEKTDKEDSQKEVEEVKSEVPEQEIGSAPVLPIEEKSKKQADSSKPLEEDEPQEEKIVNLDDAPKDAAIIESIDDEDVEVDEPEEIKDEAEQDKQVSEIDPIVEDPETEEAINDIVAKESDDLLKAEDEKLAKAFEPQQNRTLGQKIKGFFKSWWNNPKARWATIIIIVLLLALTFLIPKSRYFVLNSIGLRGSVSVVVIDNSTSQPLKNVNVKIADVSVKTDSSGTAELTKVKLGEQEVDIEKRAFASEKRKTTVRLSKNTLPESRLIPTGVQYSFVVTDYLSGKPVDKAEATSGEANAISDSDGKIKLTVDETDDDSSFDVYIKKSDYRDEKITINNEEKTEQNVVLVSSRKHVFVSKRSGKYDVYSIDIDGKNEKLLLAGTGSERDDIALAAHPMTDVVALVSTRDNKTNKDGFLLSTLTLINAQNEETKTVATSERIQLIDWIGDDLIFVQAVSGASAANPKRHTLISYDYKTGEDKELAASNYFNDVVAAGGKIYYAQSSAYQKSPAELYRVNSDGSNRTTILNQEVWNIFRVDYENLALSVGQSWYNVRIGEDKATALASQPTNLSSRIYVDSSDKKYALWVDNRDGKGVLLNYQPETKDEQVLRSQSGLKNPVRWLNSKDVIYRVSTEQETADYAISLDGGEPKKITDVTNTNSVDKWYYY